MKNILDTDIEQLKEDQYNTLKEHTIKVLGELITLLKGDELEVIEEDYLFYSPAGDCMGDDNTCINFTWNKGVIVDMGDVIDRLKKLKGENK